jgi:hypothetical protein
MIRCCLCAPDQIREGRIRDGGAVPLCAEHHAQGFWRARQPAPTDSPPMSMIEQRFGRAMLDALAPIAATG